MHKTSAARDPGLLFDTRAAPNGQPSAFVPRQTAISRARTLRIPLGVTIAGGMSFTGTLADGSTFSGALERQLLLSRSSKA